MFGSKRSATGAADWLDAESDRISRVRRGEEAAFLELHERYVDLAYRYCFYRTSSICEAEDVTEQVFLKAWEEITTWETGLPFPLWLCRVARDLLSENQRLCASRGLVDGEPIAGDSSQDELRVAIRSLSEDDQDILILRFILRFDLSETALVLRQSEEEVSELQLRALGKIKDRFSDDNVLEEMASRRARFG